MKIRPLPETELTFETHLAILDQSVNYIADSVNRIENQFETVNNKFNKLNENIDKINDKIDNNFKWLLSAASAGLFSVIGLIFHIAHCV